MSDFVNFVGQYLVKAAAGAALTAAFGALILWAAAKHHKKRHGAGQPFPWARSVLFLILAGYLAAVLFVTVRGGSHYSGSANFHLFRAWREAWNSFSERAWLNVLLNIALFVPLGILLPLIWKKLQRWYLMLAAGFGTSLFIEISQLLKGSGLFDVDDLFTNTLGTMVGFWLIMAILSFRIKRWLRAGVNLLALLAAAASLGSIFVAYNGQEYGNLSTSPAFRVNTKNVQWEIACDLPEELSTAEIYRTEVWDREKCEAFGRDFFKKLGIGQLDVTIYNDEVYLREHNGTRILEVFYHGGYYTYTDLGMDKQFTEAGEADLRQSLREYGIELPDGAQYSYEGNTHYFRVDRHVEENIMTDGEIAVQWEKDGGIRTIDNALLKLTYHSQVAVISPSDAARRLMDGYISGGDWFERKNPAQVQITSCELAWQIDTKGFYQPVYRIRLYDSESGYDSLQIVPAIA